MSEFDPFIQSLGTKTANLLKQETTTTKREKRRLWLQRGPQETLEKVKKILRLGVKPNDFSRARQPALHLQFKIAATHKKDPQL